MNDKTKAEMIDFIVTWRATHGGSISEHNHRRLLQSWSIAEVRKLYDKIQVGEVGASQAEAPKPDRSLPDKFDETPDEQYGGVPLLEYRKGWNAAIDESARLAAAPSDEQIEKLIEKYAMDLSEYHDDNGYALDATKYVAVEGVKRLLREAAKVGEE